jgi:hypothetical protein
VLVAASAASAQVADHLQCYKIKDPVALKGVVDLDSPQLGAAAGCRVSKAKLFCVPAEKTVVSASNGAQPLVPLPHGGPAVATDGVCYKVKCPTVTLADQQVTDQFGTRTLSKLKASMLCTPAVKGAAVCGDGVAGVGEACDGGDLGGATCVSAGFPSGGTLACGPGCTLDTSGCARVGLPVTGQTIAYTADKNDGIVGAVAVPDDGTLEVGAPYAYNDNGDGTVTDLVTGLMWTKKSDDGSLHDWDNQYRWSGDGSQETIWDWLDDVNAEGGVGFAGHADWRIPNARELESIQRLEGGTPGAVHPVFDAACAPGCAVTTCACTKGGNYWTSTTVANNPTRAWTVAFSLGGTVVGLKDQLTFVRAVRTAGP